MNIVKTPITPYKHFKDLTYGDVFAYKDATFMKTDMGKTINDKEGYYAINLHDGRMYLFFDKYIVIPVEDVSLNVSYRTCGEAERRWKKDKDE